MDDGDDLQAVDEVIAELGAARRDVEESVADADAWLLRNVVAEVEQTSNRLAAELQRVRDQAATELAELVRRDARRRVAKHTQR